MGDWLATWLRGIRAFVNDLLDALALRVGRAVLHLVKDAKRRATIERADKVWRETRKDA